MLFSLGVQQQSRTLAANPVAELLVRLGTLATMQSSVENARKMMVASEGRGLRRR